MHIRTQMIKEAESSVSDLLAMQSVDTPEHALRCLEQAIGHAMAHYDLSEQLDKIKSARIAA